MKKKVILSNELVRAAYTLSLNEKRLVMYAVSQLGRDSDSKLISFSAIECGRFYKMSESSARRCLKSAMDSLWERELVMPDGLGHRWIITRGKYEEGSLRLQFHPELEPHLFDLKERFTQYFLERASDFKLFYTWRIFEILMQFKSTGKVLKNLDDFKHELELTDYYSKDFGRIRSKVIQPAINEIRVKSGLNVTWEATASKGRKVDQLKFTFPTEQQKTLTLNQKKAVNKKAGDKKVPPDNSAAIEAASRKLADEQMVKLLKQREKKSTV